MYQEMASFLRLGQLLMGLLVTLFIGPGVDGYFIAQPWKAAHATFYGDETASATIWNGYGTDTAALSSVMFNNGYACGSCFQIKCYGSPNCYKGYPYTKITATNICPPNWSQDSNNGGWCNPPRVHFDMSKPAFMKIAQWKAGIVPVMYRRVPCARAGGLKFRFEGNGYWLLVYVMNVSGGGDVSTMSVKGTKTGWIKMSHNWGASYQAFATLSGQALSFTVVSYTTRETVTAYNVAPANWQTGMTYSSTVNFR